MKKFLTFLTASLLLVLFALPVGAASRAELSLACNIISSTASMIW